MKSKKVNGPDHLNITNPITPDLFIAGVSSEIKSEMNEKFGRLIGPNNLWDTALDLGLHEDPKVAFHGSWALEWAFYDDREAFRPHIPHFVANFLKATNGSVHRHYTKMMWDMLHRGMLRPDIAQAERIAEKAFDLLIAPATKTAVKVWCMEILFCLAPRLDWVAEQLRETVRQILESNPSRGLANRAGKVLRRIDERDKLKI